MSLVKRNGMKLALAILAGLFLSAALPGTVEAKHSKHRRVAHHCSSCHAPVYAEYRFVGYDRCGHPVYGWVELPHHCSHHGQGYERSYGGGRDPVADIIAGILRGMAR